jgi:hypothetical protein
MPKMKIDDFVYNSEDFSEQGQTNFHSLKFLEGQLQKLRSEIAIYQTAHVTYVATLRAEIETSGIEPTPVEETAGEEA